MKPEYVGIGNFDTINYVYAYCKCPLPVDYAIKWPLIKDGKVHRYSCTCEDCGTEVGVIAKSYGPEVYHGVLIKTMTSLPEHCYECPCHDGESGYCQADKEHRYSDYRPFWCPLAVIDDRNENNSDILNKWIGAEVLEYKDKNATIREDDKCQSCEKDWTKCSTCPVMMKRVKEMKE